MKLLDVQPTRNTVVQYCLKDHQSITKAKVLPKQPKKIGKWKDWLNVQVVGKDDRVQSTGRMFYGGEKEIVDAMQKEYQNLLQHDVFDVIDDEGQSTISTKYFFMTKLMTRVTGW